MRIYSKKKPSLPHITVDCCLLKVENERFDEATSVALKVSSIRMNNVTGDALLYTPHHFGVNAFRRFYSKSHKVMFLC